MKNSSEHKRYKTNPNFDAYLLYSYIQMKRNASDKRSRDKADKLIYEYLNNYITVIVVHSKNANFRSYISHYGLKF